MYVVLDSNIWLSELGLNSSLGAAARFYMKNKQVKLVLPNVVRLEVEHNLCELIHELRDAIAKDHRQLLAIFGKLKEIVLPTDDDIDAKVQEIFRSLGIEVLDTPFTFESAHSSYLKTIKKLAPNLPRSQQFKDGVIWADCCELLKTGDVCLVTGDKGFYEGADLKGGLARTLLDEAKPLGHAIRIFNSLSDLLSEIKQDVDIPPDALIRAYLEFCKDDVKKTLERNGFALGPNPNVVKQLFATERADLLYLKFTIAFSCPNVGGSELEEGRLILKGDCSYDIETKTFLDFRQWSQDFSFLPAPGLDRVVQRITTTAISAHLGHKDVRHVVRFDLSSE